MKTYSYILELAHGLLKTCIACNGIGQRKGYQMAPLSVYDALFISDDKVPISHVITRCNECCETGRIIDWDKWCEFKQDNMWPIVQEVEKVFDRYYQEVPS